MDVRKPRRDTGFAVRRTRVQMVAHHSLGPIFTCVPGGVVRDPEEVPRVQPALGRARSRCSSSSPPFS